MSRKRWFYVIFFLALVLGFYFFLRTVIPGFNGVRLPALSTVKPFAFTDQDGARVTNRDMTGKVYLASFFFTTCHGICPRMNNNLKTIYGEFRSDTMFRILSHTVDPGTDSVARLKHYADSLGIDSRTWLLVTGDKDSLYEAARLSYLVDDPQNNVKPIDEQFLHTQLIALVDKNGRVRKIYDGLKQDELREMRGDVKKLLGESLGSPAPGNVFQGNPN